jgi:ubiquitin-like protein Pup
MQDGSGGRAGARRITMSQEQTKRQGGGGGDDEDGAEDVDTILDEIDDVLEENAEDFVRAYVQKGGE